MPDMSASHGGSNPFAPWITLLAAGNAVHELAAKAANPDLMPLWLGLLAFVGHVASSAVHAYVTERLRKRPDDAVANAALQEADGRLGEALKELDALRKAPKASA